MAATLAQAIEGSLAKARDPTAYVAGEAKAEVRVCDGSACHASGCSAVSAAFRKELASRGLVDSVRLVETGCHGFCEQGPIVVLWPEGILYPRVRPDDVARIVEASVVNDGVYARRLYRDPTTKQPIACARRHPLLQPAAAPGAGAQRQDRPPLDRRLHRPTAATGRWPRRSTTTTPSGSSKRWTESGLRGRGGAGFPTGTKWRLCRNAPGDGKYVICNADEGDPGAFMDRSRARGHPHAVIEGMIIGAYAIGAARGLRLRARTSTRWPSSACASAIAQARERGLLGDNILGSGFAFDIRINDGAGAFVCGEETALMASHRRPARHAAQRPPYPAVEGLFGKPTIINNVET